MDTYENFLRQKIEKAHTVSSDLFRFSQGKHILRTITALEYYKNKAKTCTGLFGTHTKSKMTGETLYNSNFRAGQNH